MPTSERAVNQDCSASISEQELIEFFNDRNPHLLRYLSWQVNCPHTAEELAQETYVRFLKQSSPRGISDLNAFLFTIAANLARDHLRSRQRAREHLPLEDDLVDPGPSTEELVESQCLERALLEALSNLPEKTREVLLLYRVDGLRYRDIAERLGISERTVEYHLRQALILCRRHLTKVGGTEE